MSSDHEGTSSNYGVSVVVLAAGRASRTQPLGHKLFAEFDSLPLVRRSTLIASSCDCLSAVVVTGYRHAEMSALLADLPVSIVRNTEYENGMGLSLAYGVAAAQLDGPEGIMVILADMPALTCGHLDKLIDVFRLHNGQKIVRATGFGAPGNPVIFPKSTFQRLRSLRGDMGGRDLVRYSGLPVVPVEIGEAALMDVDTPEMIAAAGGRFV
ncbi:nucleotidyltransferase family protein [Rhizobium sp. S152]|uniref:nucleotidyltransferase family protein n=1 Tax=Rhizobium sp. S152 TaxID=3055038 RepID=UPI0025A933AC|nr:nucleotidyltransferase family protein [Rhizobium sp. S152]MDM9627396.1 nucleotidyltransferase family protein [Rhizobium sp. S152]